MSDVAFRAPRADDWPAILSLAELSLGEIPIVPSQLEWLNNRKSFSPSEGIQHHFVATSSERIVGYACIEHRNEAADGEIQTVGGRRTFRTENDREQTARKTPRTLAQRRCMPRADGGISS